MNVKLRLSVKLEVLAAPVQTPCQDRSQPRYQHTIWRDRQI
ncbi:hypothetical protein [Nostoc sp. LPT]|nr:hypothetical protein [Nostoc sp. LPT]